MMPIIYYNIILSAYLILLENGIYLQLISLMLFNLSSYSIISKYSYKNVTNYFILSSISLLLIVYGYMLNPTYKDYYYILTLLAIFIKLNSFPFTSWIIPIYRSLKLKYIFLILILTKLIYLTIIFKFHLNTFSYQLLFIILCFGSLISLNSKSLVEVLIYSGSMQICFLINSVFTGNYILFYFYLIIYLLSIFNIYLNICNFNRYLVKYYLYSINFYMLIGIPPFISFFNKYSNLLDIYLIISNVSNIYFILAFILSTIYISYLYFNYLHNLLILNFFNFYKLNKGCFIVTISFIFISIYYLDLIIL